MGSEVTRAKRRPDRLPVYVQLLPGESLPAMVHRVAERLGLTVKQLWPEAPTSLQGLYDDPSVETVRSLSHAVGIGRNTLSAQTLGCRLPGALQLPRRDPMTMVCSCCRRSGHLWTRVAWVLVCPDCGSPLRRRTDSAPDFTPLELGDLWIAQSELLALLARTRDREDPRLQRFRRLTRAYGMAVVPDEDLATQARVLVASWQSSQSPALFRAARLTVALDTELVDRAANDRDEQTLLDALEVAVARAELWRAIAEVGLGQQHVPAALSRTPEVFLEGQQEQEASRNAALALLRELVLVRGGPGGESRRPRMESLWSILGLPRKDSTALATDLGNSVAGLTYLTHHVHRLNQEGLTDFHHARAVLAGLRRAPTSILRSVPGLRIDAETAKLAAAWIWIHHTRGTPRGGPHPLKQRSLREFNESLTAEGRLVLADYGATLLASDLTLDTVLGQGADTRVGALA
ncbi:hypothetical protein BN10_140074 [Phycicoccus elongatus Lp2]|uniref:TniQ protein n=2 Tax=Phycicoccus elongatus TaxID=101689 RepID=N0DYD1_9MICO|nr:hypothetical protein BN10_140074 [Phycicoccus elongatus Lp2]